MKRSRALTLVLMAPVPVLLAGCDDAPADMTKKGFYTDIAACEKDGNAHDVCQRAMDSANQAHATNAPKFKTKEECIAEFGDLCHEHEHESGLWGPLMTGFLLSQLFSPGRPVQYIDSYPIYRTRTGGYMQYDPGYSSGSGGYVSYGSSVRSYHSVSVTPNRSVTASRSGFGSVASARSGWGGKSSGAKGGGGTGS
jgi:uncharacterized protein YgiB involved in biofilm formation